MKMTSRMHFYSCTLLFLFGGCKARSHNDASTKDSLVTVKRNLHGFDGVPVSGLFHLENDSVTHSVCLGSNSVSVSKCTYDKASVKLETFVRNLKDVLDSDHDEPFELEELQKMKTEYLAQLSALKGTKDPVRLFQKQKIEERLAVVQADLASRGGDKLLLDKVLARLKSSGLPYDYREANPALKEEQIIAEGFSEAFSESWNEENPQVVSDDASLYLYNLQGPPFDVTFQKNSQPVYFKSVRINTGTVPLNSTSDTFGDVLLYQGGKQILKLNQAAVGKVACAVMPSVPPPEATKGTKIKAEKYFKSSGAFQRDGMYTNTVKSVNLILIVPSTGESVLILCGVYSGLSDDSFEVKQDVAGKFTFGEFKQVFGDTLKSFVTRGSSR